MIWWICSNLLKSKGLPSVILSNWKRILNFDPSSTEQSQWPLEILISRMSFSTGLISQFFWTMFIENLYWSFLSALPAQHSAHVLHHRCASSLQHRCASSSSICIITEDVHRRGKFWIKNKIIISSSPLWKNLQFNFTKVFALNFLLVSIYQLPSG